MHVLREPGPRRYFVAFVLFLGLSSLAWAADAYHGNRESKIFHDSGCRFYHCKACTVPFKTKAEAKKAGYRPCKVCKP